MPADLGVSTRIIASMAAGRGRQDVNGLLTISPITFI